ncbi:hypothetical protein [Pseudomonas psychrophila]|uniref:hypothetical protein n=1 Tax=Pseudomonas psychrophila TaxID=122355 RepID=UPI000A65B64C|nr:hypothetical protein [Pseudomonas psychrophila]
MTALRRTVQIRGAPMGLLDLQTICDKCNRSRAHGNHTKCSKLRQAEAVERLAREKV